MWLRDFSLVCVTGTVVPVALRQFFVLLLVLHLNQEDLLSSVTADCEPHTNTFSFMTRLQCSVSVASTHFCNSSPDITVSGKLSFTTYKFNCRAQFCRVTHCFRMVTHKIILSALK